MLSKLESKLDCACAALYIFLLRTSLKEQKDTWAEPSSAIRVFNSQQSNSSSKTISITDA
jgi:hypothetical protein